MKKQDFEKLKASLIERGYKEYNQNWHNEDYVLCKGFHKENNKFEESRSAYQIVLSIYDYTLKPEYWDRLPESYKDYVGIQVEIEVSRTANERIDLTLMWYEDTTIEETESTAESFYSWVVSEYPVPKED